METVTPDVRPRTAPSDFVMFARSGGDTAETPTEKLVLLPSRSEQSPALHAWADARFWVDIMMEHALFFAMLMPQETAPDERLEALRFKDSFAKLLAKIESGGPPDDGSIKTFADFVIEEVKPFIDYKARLGQAQRLRAPLAQCERLVSVPGSGALRPPNGRSRQWPHRRRCARVW